LQQWRWWLCDYSWHNIRSIRLQRRIRKLDVGMVCGKKGMVLHQCRQGMPANTRWVCLDHRLKGSEAEQRFLFFLAPHPEV